MSPVRPILPTICDTRPAQNVEPIEPRPAIGAKRRFPSFEVSTDDRNAQCCAYSNCAFEVSAVRKVDAQGAFLFAPERMHSCSQRIKPCETNLNHRLTGLIQIYLKNESEEDNALAQPALVSPTSLQQLEYCCTEDRDKRSDQSVRPQSACRSPSETSAVKPKHQNRKGRDATHC